MRIPFRTSSHAEKFVSVCRSVIDEAFPEITEHRLPTQKIRNVFSAAAGYGSFEEMGRVLAHGSDLGAELIRPNAALIDAAEKGFTEALQIASNYHFPELPTRTLESWPRWLAMQAAERYCSWSLYSFHQRMLGDKTYLRTLQRGKLFAGSVWAGWAKLEGADRLIKQLEKAPDSYLPSWLAWGAVADAIADNRQGMCAESGDRRSPALLPGAYFLGASLAMRNRRKTVDSLMRQGHYEDGFFSRGHADHAWRCIHHPMTQAFPLATPSKGTALHCHWCQERFSSAEPDLWIDLRKQAQAKGWVKIDEIEEGIECPPCHQIRKAAASSEIFSGTTPEISERRQFNQCRASLAMLACSADDVMAEFFENDADEPDFPAPLDPEIQAEMAEWKTADLEHDAAVGIVEAQLELAKRYRDGNDAAEDPRRAYEWFRNAAEQGCAEAIYEAAKLDMTINNGPSAKAGEWIAKAAREGHLPAAVAVTHAEYFFKKGAFRRNVTIEDLDAALDQHDGDRIFAVALLYFEGSIVPHDIDEFVRLGEAAQKAGSNLPALFEDSEQYAHGIGDMQAKRGLSILEEFANLGEPGAAFYLWRKYTLGGDGVKVSPKRADRWRDVGITSAMADGSLAERAAKRQAARRATPLQ